MARQASKCLKVKLNDGFDIPILGLGTYLSAPGEVYKAVSHAIDVGYRHIDCATYYENEAEIGQAIRDKIKSGGVKREDLYVVSKSWNSHRTPELLKKYFDKSLNELTGDYIDLYLIHWPFSFASSEGLRSFGPDGKQLFSDIDYVDVWKTMEELKESGKAKSIGVSNFNSLQIKRLLENCSIPPAMNQVECHPYLNQEKLRAFCEEKGVKLTAYRPLGPQDSSEGMPKFQDNPIVQQIAKAHDKLPAQVVIRFQIQRGVIVIPKSSNEERISQNFDVFDFELSDAQMESLLSLERNGRQIQVKAFAHLKHFPFNDEF